MKINKSFCVVVSLVATVSFSIAATSPKVSEARSEASVAHSEASAVHSRASEVHYENLKVLPKDISSRDLQGIMVDDFQDGLGVTCGFCHANAKNGRGLDFASDAKPEKEISRAMMRMTLGINKKYFRVSHPRIGGGALTVTCATCHKGEPFPEAGR